MLQDLEGLNMAGLFICDLSMHDFSRDLLLASKRTTFETIGYFRNIDSIQN